MQKSEVAKTWRTAIIEALMDANAPLHYEDIASRVLNSGFPTAGRTPAKTVSRELTTHPDLFKKTADGIYVLATKQDDEDFEFARPKQSTAGQGFMRNTELRKRIELHAMRQATDLFGQLDWHVVDVSATRPYDLHCSRGDGELLAVEVKGTTSYGRKVVLTKNEVAFARAFYPRTALFVLSRVELREDDGVLIAEGGEAQLFEPWDVDRGQLEALNYAYWPAT